MKSHLRKQQLALGDTPNLAARPQGLTTPNTVVVSAATLGLMEGFFTYQALGEHTLKGVDEPLPVYQLLAASGAQTRLDAPRLDAPGRARARGGTVAGVLGAEYGGSRAGSAAEWLGGHW